jgi:hypothetical protein
MRLSSETRFQYADAAPAVHVTLPGDRRMPSSLPTVAPVGVIDNGVSHHPYALARRPLP